MLFRTCRPEKGAFVGANFPGAVQAKSLRTRAKKGAHPYRVVLQDVVARLRGSKLRFEALMQGEKPDDNIPWCSSAIETFIFPLCCACMSVT